MPNYRVRIREIYDYEVEMEASTEQRAKEDAYDTLYDTADGRANPKYSFSGDGEITCEEIV